MNIIIPMAGMGKRMRPHTLTTPKPLLPIAGKSIVERLIEELIKICKQNVNEIGFIIGDFGEDVENNLLELANKYNAIGKIYYQKEVLGTGHAIYCAEESLKGETIVAFADTIFYANFNIDSTADSVIWVKEVEDPSAFGVIKLNSDGTISDFIEKPKQFVSNKAIIGIYYFKYGEVLREELKYIIENDIKGNNEYQLTDALEIMKNKGLIFKPAVVQEWLDCGNKDATVSTNTRVLQLNYKDSLISSSAKIENSVIIKPCFVGENVKIINSVIGPNVSVECGSEIIDSRIKDSIINNSAKIISAFFNNSMIGKNTFLNYKFKGLNIGDFNIIEE